MDKTIGMGSHSFDIKTLKDNDWSIVSMSYISFCGMITLVLARGREVRQVAMTPQLAVSCGFINPNMLQQFVKDK